MKYRYNKLKAFADRLDTNINQSYNLTAEEATWLKEIVELYLKNMESSSRIISESDCDYRKKECTNEGETIDGKWVCSNHKRTAYSEKDLRECWNRALEVMVKGESQDFDTWFSEYER